MLPAWPISLAGEKCAQKNVTPKTPCAPANAFLRLSGSSTSPATTSAPSFASSFALSEFTSRVIARAAKPPFGSFKIARTRPPPCAPVAPNTAMIFLSAMVLLSPEIYLLRYFFTDDFRAVGQRLELQLRHHPRQRLHAAVGAQID